MGAEKTLRLLLRSATDAAIRKRSWVPDHIDTATEFGDPIPELKGRRLILAGWADKEHE